MDISKSSECYEYIVTGGHTDQGVEVEALMYKAIESYEAQDPGQVSFKAGDLITVLDKMEDGESIPWV